MSAYEAANKEKERLMDDAILLALAVLAVQGKREDDISAREACALYDRRWLQDRTSRGMLHCSRKGPHSNSALVYSRFEIEALKRAEKGIAEACEDAEERAKLLNKFINQV